MQPERWLDSSGGRLSVAAAVLNHSDAEGLLRGSSWAAGKPDAVSEAAPHASTPLPAEEALRAMDLPHQPEAPISDSHGSSQLNGNTGTVSQHH